MGGVKNEVHNTEKILLQGKDAFDPLEWEPDLSSMLSVDESPKPVPMKPQPVTYTTVGSLVDPKSVQQFTAPNRIQREGANRRPLMSIIANRSFDSLFQTRGPPPPLNKSNSMQYAQQLSRNQSQIDSIQSLVSETLQDSILPSHREGSSPPTHSHSILIATDQEKDILKAQFNGKALISQNQDSISNTPRKLDVCQYSTGNIKNSSTIEEEKTNLNLQTRVYGMEKMQTLQRLSKFKNPMQEWAKNKLSGFSVVNQPTVSSKSYAADISSHILFSLSGDKKYGGPKLASEPSENKIDKISDHFSTGKISKNQLNQVRCNLNSAQLRSGAITCPPAYPQPLTAGPPGQRQSSSSFNQYNFYHQDIKANNFKMSDEESTPNDFIAAQSVHQTNSFYLQGGGYEQVQMMPWDGHTCSLLSHTCSALVDTLSQKDAAQYYPYSWPSGTTEITEKGSDTCSVPIWEQTATKNPEDLENWFYSGQRRFAKITSQIGTDNSHDQRNRERGLLPSSSPGIVLAESELKQVLITELDRRPTSSYAAPLVDSLLDTLFEYSDKTPGSRANLSHFIENPISYLDLTENGECSLFGEDPVSTSLPALDLNVEKYQKRDDRRELHNSGRWN
ncbi:hypothetical protein K3495_g8519 [Podosphaera aphanis]|nr:hypothetical protein K3495_g8519 [Podosphaera aphanis]